MSDRGPRPLERHRPCEAALTRLSAYAVTPPGIEGLTYGELVGLGLRPADVEMGGVPFETDAAGLCRANLCLRTASRILVRLDSFVARDFRRLERHARRIPWDRFSRPGDAISIRVSSRKSRLYHQRAIAERVGQAVGEAGRRVHAASSPAADDPPDAALHVRLFRDRCTLSVDSTGAHLHRRGYRLATAKAPLRETLAAAALLAVEWDPGTPLVDPMCGSGTLAIEAALLAGRRAPGSVRSFACEAWPEVGPGVWDEARAAAHAGTRPVPAPIVGSDRDQGAIRAATSNGERAGAADDVRWFVRALSAAGPPAGAPAGLLIANPPYGGRIGGGADLRDLYAALGNVARRAFAGWTLAVLAAEASLVAQIGIPMTRCLSTRHGGLGIGVWRGSVS